MGKVGTISKGISFSISPSYDEITVTSSTAVPS